MWRSPASPFKAGGGFLGLDELEQLVQRLEVVRMGLMDRLLVFGYEHHDAPTGAGSEFPARREPEAALEPLAR